jgi:rod shape-determining protein MreC
MLLVILSIVFMTMDHRFQQLQAVRSGLSLIIAPLQYLVDLPISLTRTASDSLSLRSNLLKENEQLHEENLKLRARLQKYNVLVLENERLRQFMQASERLEAEVQLAEILAVDLDPYKQLVTINKGTRDDVFVGQPMLDESGVMGQVIEATHLNAVGMLISDPSHALPVQVNRNGLRTLAVGTGNPSLMELKFIPTSADIIVGDTLSTSGLGGRFPAEYPVAEVTRIERTPGEPFAYIEARPLAHLDRSQEVMLVVPPELPEPALESEGELSTVTEEAATDKVADDE